jgi:YYY domain-containing protein
LSCNQFFMIWQFLSWYLVVQLITLAALPLTVRLFPNLADRGYAFAKSLGILLVGLILWLGTSYGLLRNETGGAWLALLLMAGVSVAVGRDLRQLMPGNWQLSLRPVIVVEVLFLLAFAAWTYVRAFDPAANHTEKPMDLMFMNSIWVSPTYPPQDAWLSGYAISYYYLGYWLLTTIGRLAGQPPEIAYTVGQACWFGLLLIGCFGVGYNLLRHGGRGQQTALIGGLLAAVAVGLSGNLQIIFEWLYANGVDLTGLARWVDVDGFPENAQQTGLWYIGFDWWSWGWRPSRVLEDLTLSGGHIEVIDEFPIFSYVLGDNHPHVIGMPMVLLVIALAQNLFFGRPATSLLVNEPTEEGAPSWRQRLQVGAHLVIRSIPLGGVGAVLVVVATGALVFLNTWDFPPYWLLLMVSLFALLLRLPKGAITRSQALVLAGGAGIALVVGVVALYLPYFLTAQSQAGGFVPNFFNPTRFPQFVVMFGFALCGLVALIGLAWPQVKPSLGALGGSAALIYGGPLIFLLISLALAFGTARGQQYLSLMALPEGATSYWPFIVERWSRQGLTFLVIGALLSAVISLIWRMIGQGQERSADAQGPQQALLFALLLAALGLLLVYAPEFVYLRDNFGSRMNTIFKFYYQAWLLFGLSTTYAIVEAFSRRRQVAPWLQGVAALSLVLIAGGLLYPLAATYSKTGGFAGQPTLNAIGYVEQQDPEEWAAIRWVQANTPPDALIVQGIGGSYDAQTVRISAATGRPTLLGWEGHEGQWRGQAYGAMAGGRKEALELIYRSGSTDQILQILAAWDIDYVYVGRAERSRYEMTPFAEERLAQTMDLVFESGDVRIYGRRGR